MSASGLTSDNDVAVTERLDRRWSVPRSLQLPLPATAAVVYLGVRVLGLLFAAFLLRHGAYRRARGLPRVTATSIKRSRRTGTTTG